MIGQELRDGKRHPGGHQGIALLEHVFARQDRVDDRGIGARPADAHLFERAGQGRFAIARRGLRRVRLRLELAAIQPLADFHRGQHGILFGQLALGVVAAFDIGSQVAGKVDRLAGDLEPGPAAFDADRDSPSPRVGHLAGHGPLPNQVVQPEFVRVQLAAQRFGKREGVAGRANRLVRFLGVLDLGLVQPHLIGQELAPVLRLDQLARRLDGHLGQVSRVGSHVRDVAVFVQALGHLHRPPRREAELAVGLLLQRAGRERRRRPRRERLVFERGHLELDPRQPLGQLSGGRLVEQQQPGFLEKPGGRIKVFAGGNFAAVDRHQPGLERFAARFGQRADQVPIRGRDERHPLPLALDDQPHRHALHASG